MDEQYLLKLDAVFISEIQKFKIPGAVTEVSFP
jgi:hypothetical protein